MLGLRSSRFLRPSTRADCRPQPPVAASFAFPTPSSRPGAARCGAFGCCVSRHCAFGRVGAAPPELQRRVVSPKPDLCSGHPLPSVGELRPSVNACSVGCEAALGHRFRRATAMPQKSKQHTNQSLSTGRPAQQRGAPVRSVVAFRGLEEPDAQWGRYIHCGSGRVPLTTRSGTRPAPMKHRCV